MQGSFLRLSFSSCARFLSLKNGQFLLISSFFAGWSAFSFSYGGARPSGLARDQEAQFGCFSGGRGRAIRKTYCDPPGGPSPWGGAADGGLTGVRGGQILFPSGRAIKSAKCPGEFSCFDVQNLQDVCDNDAINIENWWDLTAKNTPPPACERSPRRRCVSTLGMKAGGRDQIFSRISLAQSIWLGMLPFSSRTRQMSGVISSTTYILPFSS